MSKKKKRSLGQELIKGLKEILAFERGKLALKVTEVTYDPKTKKILKRKTKIRKK